MGRKKISGCVGCGLPCLGSSCSNNKITVFYCDDCGEEFAKTDLYKFDDEELCLDCIKDRLEKID